MSKPCVNPWCIGGQVPVFAIDAAGRLGPTDGRRPCAACGGFGVRERRGDDGRLRAAIDELLDTIRQCAYEPAYVAVVLHEARVQLRIKDKA